MYQKMVENYIGFQVDLGHTLFEICSPIFTKLKTNHLKGCPFKNKIKLIPYHGIKKLKCQCFNFA
jgi:hypothetical protein